MISPALGDELITTACEWHALADEALTAGDLALARRLASRAIDLITFVDGRAHPDVANLLMTVAAVRNAGGGDVTDDTASSEAIAILRTLPPSKDGLRLLVRALVQAGDQARAEGRYPEAALGLEEAMTLAEEHLGPLSPEIAFAGNALGVLGKYQGRFGAAAQAYARALAAAEAAGDLAQQATIHHNLGGLEHSRGRPELAEPAARESVRLRAACTPVNARQLAADRAALAAILHDLGRPEEATELLEPALAFFEERLGANDYEVAVTLHNLAAIAHGQGDSTRAADLYERSLSIKEACLGAEHPELTPTLNNLAVVREDQGRVEDALTLLARTLDLLDGAVQQDHPRLVAAAGNYARVLERSGITADAPAAHDPSGP